MSKVFGIGVDLVKSKRVYRLFDRYGHKFLKKALHENEISKFNKMTKKSSQIQYLATMYVLF